MFRSFRLWLDRVLSSGSVARDARAANEVRHAVRYELPRPWKFVNANGPGQSLSPRDMTHDEAVKFCREILGGAYVQTDFDGSIVFFAGSKNEG
jgi:hypothetical protein